MCFEKSENFLKKFETRKILVQRIQKIRKNTQKSEKYSENPENYW